MMQRPGRTWLGFGLCLSVAACTREPAAPQIAVHDVALESLVVTPAVPTAGESVRLEAMVRNVGQELETDFSVSFFRDADGDSVAEANERVGAPAWVEFLDPGGSLLVAARLDSIPLGLQSFVAVLDLEDDVSTNNVVWRGAEAVDPGLLRLHVIDVGQGDAILVEFPGGARVLVDAGDVSWNLDGTEPVFDYLVAAEATSLDGVVVTHRDQDHYGGLEALRGAGVRFETLWEGCQAPGDSTEPSLSGFDEYVAELEASGEVEVLTVARGDTLLEAGGGRLIVLNPGTSADPAECADAEDRNNESVVLRVELDPNFSALLTGDIGEDREHVLIDELDSGPLGVDVVKVPHHGSASSSTAEWVAATSPSLALVSVGEGNGYGHPAQEVLERWESAGATIARTDRDGSLLVVTDGFTFRLLQGVGP